MANEDIVFKARLDDGGKGAKSLTDLKKEFKELNTELSKSEVGTEKYLKTLQKLWAVKDDMGDLRDTINAFNPEGKVGAFANVAGKLASGFQAATGAAALLGVESEELQKTLLKVQAATAFAEGIRSLSGLKDAFTVVGTVIKTSVIPALTTLKGAILATGIGALVVAIGVLIYETNEYNDAIEEEYGRQQKLNEELKKTTDEYLKQAAASEELRNARKGGINELERELKLLEASGASADEIFEKKQRIADAELYNLKVRRATVDGDTAKQDEITQKILDKEAEKTALILGNEKRIRDEKKKNADEEADRKYKEYLTEQTRLEKEREKNQREGEELQAKYLKDRDAKFKLEEEDKERLAKEEEEKAKREAAALENSKKIQEQYRKEIEAEDLATAQKVAAAKVSIEQTSFKAAQNLSNLFFTTQLNKAKGNAQAELEIKKKQFAVEKAFSIVRATIDGARAVVAALTVPPPFGPILAGVNAVAAATQVALIAATQFSGGNASYGNIQAPSAAVSAAPQIQAQAPVIGVNTTRFNEQGQNLSLNVTASLDETQATKTQKRVVKLKGQATFP